MTLGLLTGTQGMLFLSGEFNTWIWSTALVIPFLSLFVSPPRGRLAEWLFRAAFVLPALGLGFMAFKTHNYLFFAILYVVILGVIKAFQLRGASDFLQLYGLVLMLIVAAAVINPGPSFGVLFVPVTLLLILCLAANNLRKGVEKAFLPEHQASVLSRRDLFSGPFVWTALLVSLLAFAGALVLFVGLPRFDPRFFNPDVLSGLSVSGFSEDVDLNSRSQIIQDHSVVMRVHVIKGDVHPPVRLRGLSFATYLSHKWKKYFRPRKPVYFDRKGRYKVVYYSGKQGRTRQVILDITSRVAGNDYRPIFGIPRMQAFELRFDVRFKRSRYLLMTDNLGSVVVVGAGARQITYREYSGLEAVTPGKLRAAGRTYPWWARKYYLQLPKSFSPRITALAHRIAQEYDNPYDKALAIRDFLRTHIHYSLRPPRGSGDPLVEFLFNAKAGPCEFFASAMVMMLRSIGIPARLVTGFYGGTMSRQGDYIDVHASDAHAWAEVFFPGPGFITMDPTPPQVILRRSTGMQNQGIRGVITAVKLWWYRWVVKYSLKKQAVLFLRMLTGDRRIDTNPYAMAARFKALVRRARYLGRGLEPVAWGAIAILLFLLAFFIFLHTFRHTRRAQGRSYFRKAERMLTRRGLARSTGQTPMEFAEIVKSRMPDVYPAFKTLVTIYYKDLFGPGIDHSDKEIIAVLLRRIRTGLRKLK